MLSVATTEGRVKVVVWPGLAWPDCRVKGVVWPGLTVTDCRVKGVVWSGLTVSDCRVKGASSSGPEARLQTTYSPLLPHCGRTASQQSIQQQQ